MLSGPMYFFRAQVKTLWSRSPKLMSNSPATSIPTSHNSVMIAFRRTYVSSDEFAIGRGYYGPLFNGCPTGDAAS